MSADVPLSRPDHTAQSGSGDEPELGGLLSRLDDLAERPVGEHHDRLAEVHEALHSALQQPPSNGPD